MRGGVEAQARVRRAGAQRRARDRRVLERTDGDGDDRYVERGLAFPVPAARDLDVPQLERERRAVGRDEKRHVSGNSHRDRDVRSGARARVRRAACDWKAHGRGGALARGDGLLPRCVRESHRVREVGDRKDIRDLVGSAERERHGALHAAPRRELNRGRSCSRDGRCIVSVNGERRAFERHHARPRLGRRLSVGDVRRRRLGERDARDRLAEEHGRAVRQRGAHDGRAEHV